MHEIKEIETTLEEIMKKTLEKLREELASVRTGRANPVMLDVIKVEVYGSQMVINQLANISIPDAKTIEIQPWDINTLEDIEKAILKSPLGITPLNDGKLLRLVMPKLTEESRLNLVKYIKQMEEQFKVTLRNARRDANAELKASEKNKEMPEDLLYKAEKDVQNTTDAYIKKIEEMIAKKEKEIMEV